MNPESSGKLLLVDDDAVIARVYANLFAKVGIEVIAASHAEDALERLKDSAPDIVLLDIFLPKVNGVEVLKQIRGSLATRDIPVVVFSTSATSRYVDAAWREGATRFLAKDHYEPAQIVAVVQELLAAAKTAEKKPVFEDSGGGGDDSRQKAFESLPILQTELRDHWHAVVTAESDDRQRKLAEVVKSVDGLKGAAELAGVAMMIQICSAFYTFVEDFQKRPGKIPESVVRTGSQAVDFLMAQCDYAVDLLKEPPVPGLVLFAHAKMTSMELLTPLRRNHLTIVSAKETTFALDLASQNRFHLVFWDADLPGPSTADILNRLRAQTTNKETPVIFVTTQDDFEARAHEATASGYDLLGKPVVPSELVVKALTYILRDRLTSIAMDF